MKGPTRLPPWPTDHHHQSSGAVENLRRAAVPARSRHRRSTDGLYSGLSISAPSARSIIGDKNGDRARQHQERARRRGSTRLRPCVHSRSRSSYDARPWLSAAAVAAVTRHLSNCSPTCDAFQPISREPDCAQRFWTEALRDQRCATRSALDHVDSPSRIGARCLRRPPSRILGSRTTCGYQASSGIVGAGGVKDREGKPDAGEPLKNCCKWDRRSLSIGSIMTLFGAFVASRYLPQRSNEA